jgi:hypothetical protein
MALLGVINLLFCVAFLFKLNEMENSKARGGKTFAFVERELIVGGETITNVFISQVSNFFYFLCALVPARSCTLSIFHESQCLRRGKMKNESREKKTSLTSLLAQLSSS